MKNLINLFVAILFMAISISLVAQTPELIPYRKGNKWGYCDRNKNLIIDCKFDDAYLFDEKNEFARVKFNDKWCFIDKKGEIVAELDYDEVNDFKEDMILVVKNEKYGFLDKQFKEVVPPKYDLAHEFSNSLALVYIIDDKEYYGYINKDGKEVIPLLYHYATDFSDGIAIVNKKIIDTKGKTVSEINAESFYEFKNGYARVDMLASNQNDMIPYFRWGFINSKGKIVIKPQFFDAQDFSEGFAAVKNENEKWGFIDEKGKLIIDYQFDEVLDFSEGLAPVKVDDKWGYIDKNGKWTIEPMFAEAGIFKYGLAKVANELYGDQGFIDKTGKIVIPIQYYFVDNHFKKGLIRVHIPQLGEAYMDIFGNKYWEE